MTNVLDSGIRPLCICNKSKRRYQLIPGSGMPWTYDKNCGKCPQRRASEEECANAFIVARELPQCQKCAHALMPAIGSMSPHIESYKELLCIECTQVLKASCQCSHHRGERISFRESMHEVAVTSRSFKDNGMTEKKLFCSNCFLKYKPKTWLEFSANKGSYDSNGEIIPLRGAIRELKLVSGEKQYDPLAQYGGMSRCWAPSKGITGTFRLVNGERLSQWIAFQPTRFIYVPFNNKSSRLLSVIRYDPESLIENENTALSTLWHSSVNRWIDVTLGTKDEPRAKDPKPMGWCYVRITGLVQGQETHTLYTSRYRDAVAEAVSNETPNPSIREWVEWCHTQPTV